MRLFALLCAYCASLDALVPPVHPTRAAPAATCARRAAAVRLLEAVPPDDVGTPIDGLFKPPAVQEGSLSVGQVMPCTVVARQEEGSYLVDIGTPRLATLPHSEVGLDPNATKGGPQVDWRGGKPSAPRAGAEAEAVAELTPGDVYEGQVLSVDKSAGVTVSLAKAQRGVAWRRVAQLAAEDLTFPSTVLRFGSAGATVAVEQLAAFLPWSHWQLAPADRTPELIGSTLPVKFLDVDRMRLRLVVSHRRVKLEGLQGALEMGQLVEGTVKSIREYGAVVSLASGMEGLLHISQLSRAYVKSMNESLGEGDPIRCVVIKLGEGDGSVGLSTKMLETRPGDMLRNATLVFQQAADRAGA